MVTATGQGHLHFLYRPYKRTRLPLKRDQEHAHTRPGILARLQDFAFTYTSVNGKASSGTEGEGQIPLSLEV